MSTTVSGTFDTRHDAEMAVEWIVQEFGIERTDVFVVAAGDENTAGAERAGSDAAALNGAITVSVDLEDGEQDPKVKSFAEMTIAHHSKSTADAKAAAAKSKVTAPPPKLMPAQAEMIAQLKVEKGPSRDAAYVAQQKAAHGQALDLQKAYAAEGTAPGARGRGRHDRARRQSAHRDVDEDVAVSGGAVSRRPITNPSDTRRAIMKRNPLPWLLTAALIPSAAYAQQGDGTNVSIAATIFKPAKIPATPERIAALGAPEGFSVTAFATGLKNARIVAVAPDGTVYLSRRDQGDVLMLKDADDDGRADGVPITVVNRPGAHGIAIHDGKFYLVTVKELFVADIQPDGRLGPLTLLAGDLPDSGQHPNRTIAWGPDDMLYISVGSTCNVCNESNPENATILRVSPDGKTRTILASGLRNTIGFDWNPRTGELWGLDHGIDFLGDEDQPEELNKIELGKKYGWPHAYADGKIYPQSTPVGDITKEEWRDTSVSMAVGYDAHAAPMQLVFYKGGSFPTEYTGDAFATMRGSWNRAQPSGYSIVRIRFQGRQAKSIEPFVTGFLTDGGRTHIARPVGLAVARDGALLMADDANGVIYRIAYDRGRKPAVTTPAPATAMRQQTERGNHFPLALARTSAAGKAQLVLSSASFAAHGAIPARHSDYQDGVSPALSWTPVAGAVSYAIVMEDPDSRPTTPFVHWLAWNIPASVTLLPEGLQEQPRLTEPDGVLQGLTTRGSTGYYGPRPPVGDPPHHYHFQLFALDTMVAAPPGSDRDTLLAAIKGHVIAKSELVGTYQQRVPPLK